MVATVGSISIDLVTNTNSFANGFKSSATTVEQQSARMAKAVATVEKGVIGIGTTLKNFGVGLAAGVGLTAIASLGGAFERLKATVGEYDKIASDAKTTGLKTDTFQALAFAAKQANVEYEGFNSSLDIFAKNSGLAERGTGALYTGLKNLNRELLRSILHTKDQEERLKLVADAMANTSDATQKAALSTVIFGKGGIEMSRILDQGRASIDKLKKTAQDLGILIPDALLQHAGELDDKLDLLSKVIEVQLGEALINAAPLLVNVTTGFANLSTEINSTAEKLTSFVNDPSWATLEKLVVALGGKPFREGSILDQLAKGTAGLASSSKDIADITAGINFLTQKLTELQDQAAHGFDVHAEITEAEESLAALKARLGEIQATGTAAAKAIGDGFTQSFRQAEIASMDALAAMEKATPKPLPTVTAYRPGTSGPPSVTDYGAGGSDIGLIDRSSRSDDSIVNGVRVRKYGGQESDPANFLTEHTDQYGAKIFDSSKNTAGYTQQTADNVSTLDGNTKKYLQGLSNDIGGYSGQTNITISKLSDVVRNNIGGLSSSILSLLTAGGGPGKAGGIGGGAYAFGDAFDPSVGSYISSWGVGKTTRPSVNFPTTSSDGSYNTSVNVQQPGTTINLNYNAAVGESTQTAKQNARAMWDQLVAAAAGQ
ncbi:hypothetical protein FKO01_04975 [Mesorhizobium sp. B2-3-3]|nr:hypothetical protein FKO01_04975 [Mesorhizobium sp. B2-3-3]